MALTYYIRSWDPRSTYPTNPQEGDICYTITKDQTWAPVGGVKKDNIVKEEIYQNGAWVEQGGGGSSDLTTAAVVFLNNVDATAHVVCPAARSLGGQDASVGGLEVSRLGDLAVDAILYKGKTFVASQDGYTLSGDTNYTQLSPNMGFVSGPCQITISE